MGNKSLGMNSLVIGTKIGKEVMQFGLNEVDAEGNSRQQLGRGRLGLSSKRTWSGKLCNGQWCVVEACDEQSDSGSVKVKSTGRSSSAAHWLCDLIKLVNLSEP